MEDQDKTKEQLIDELNEMRRKVAEFDSVQKWLNENELPYREMVNKTSEAIFVIQDGCIKFANKKTSEIIGYSTEEVLAPGAIAAFVHPDDREMVSKYHASRPQGDETHYLYAFRIVRKDGNVQWAEINSSLIIWEGRPAALCLMADITERKRTEEALRESEQKYRSVFENSPVGIYHSTVSGKFIEVNPVFARIFKYDSPEEMIAKVNQTSVADALWVKPDKRSRIVQEVQSKSGQWVVTEAQFRCKDGSVISGVASFRGLNSTSDSPGMLEGFVEDITKRKRAEQALEESEQKYRLLVDGAMEGILVAQDGMLRFANPRALEILGYSELELLDNPLTNVIHPDDREMVLSRHFRRLKGEVLPSRYTFRNLARDGVQKFIEIDNGMITWNERPAVLIFLTDITERVTIGKALHESLERYRTVADFTYDWEYWVDAEGKFLYCSPSCERITGYSTEEFIGDPDLMNRIIHPDDRTEMLDHYHNVRKVAHHTVDALDFRIIRRDGETRWIGHVCQPVYGQEGQPLGRRGSNRDITDRKRAEENNLRLATIVESSNDAIIGKTLDGTITSWNRGAERIYGYKEHEVVGKLITILAPPDREDEIQGFLEQIKSGESIQHVETVRRNNIGENIPVSLTISPIIDKEGRIIGLSTISSDISDRVKAAQQREALQKQLFQAQKMEAIGTLAGGFAHDFNNKLQVIDGCVELILFNKDLPETIKPDLEIMKQAINICSELIKGMMVFSRKTPVEFQPIELNKLVAQTRSMLTRSIPKMIEIDLLLADDLWTINASASQIDQILMNLAVNAKDAMPDGGRLTIQTQNMILDDEFLRPYPHAKPGRYVLFSVTDSGTGMEKETVKHIFEPFFTTKESDKGTGLGLAVVYGIVEQHGGRIICDSEPSVGTTFSIYFPAIEEVPQEQYSEKKEPLRGQGETILVVDDEPSFLEIVSRQLTGYNYNIITASNGKESLSLYEKHHEEIKLIILDLMMPKMGGEECLQTLLRMDPKVRVLMISGTLKPGMAEDLKEAGAKGFIKKPFDLNRMLEKIRKVVDED